MIKRTLIGVGVSVLLVLFFFGRNAVSYVRTSVGCVRDAVNSSVPVEFELERARRMITDLGPEVRKNMHLIAKEEVEVKQLEERISQMEARLAREKQDVLRLKGDLENGKGKDSFEYAGRKYSRDQVQQDLTGRFERYKTGEGTLADMRKIHMARQKSVEAARQKLEGMLASKRQLEVEVENLEARRQMVAAAEATSNYQFDDSQVGRVKELVNDLRTRLEVSEKLVSAEGSFRDEIPLHQATPGNIIDQVGEYFTPKAKVEAVAAK